MGSELELLQAVLAGRYRIDRELERGGMATVYLAHDVRHNRTVAVKVMHPELVGSSGGDRFLREIAVAAQLDHPHILPLLDSGEAGGSLYYVMPYVQGESLRARLTRERQLPLDDALRITEETADALHYAHGLGIVHRDVKPDNILLGGGHARLADFGIARALTATRDERITATGVSIGTPTYMSPEQASGDGEVDGRSDVYSLACVLYEMLVGQPPHAGATAEAIVARKFTDTPPPVSSVRPTVPPEVEAAIARALSRVPADRFATPEQFAHALRAAGSTGQQSLPRPHVLDRRAALAAIGTLTAAATLGAGWWWSGGRRGSGGAAVASLAVLPFANLSGDPEQDYFASGITEELLERLAGLSGLTVKSRTSVNRYRDTSEPIPVIARQLGVDALVEGSVSRSDDAVRIRVRLVQARPERTLWTRSYDRPLRDALQLQSEAAREIAQAIGAVVTAEHEARMARLSDVDPVAAEAYFKGRFYWNRRTADDLLRAVRHFTQATRLEPGYARAHAGLASCYVLLGASGMSVLTPAEALPRARAAARRALEIQEDVVEAHTTLAYIETYEWNWAAAERGFARALAIDPGYGTAYFWHAALLAAQGRADQAVAEARRGWEVEPVSPIIAAGVAWMLHFARRHGEAAAQARRTLELEPGFAVGYLRLGVSNGLLKRHEEALAQLHDGLRASGGDPAFVTALVRVHAAAGQLAPARRRMAELMAMRDRRYVSAYHMAAAHAAVGEVDAAFGWMERSLAERSLELAFVAVDPDMDPLRGDPRMRDVMQRMNLPG